MHVALVLQQRQLGQGLGTGQVLQAGIGLVGLLCVIDGHRVTSIILGAPVGRRSAISHFVCYSVVPAFLCLSMQWFG